MKTSHNKPRNCYGRYVPLLATLRPDQHADLRAMADRDGEPVTCLIREAVDNLLAGDRRRRPRVA